MWSYKLKKKKFSVDKSLEILYFTSRIELYLGQLQTWTTRDYDESNVAKQEAPSDGKPVDQLCHRKDVRLSPGKSAKGMSQKVGF